MRNNNQLAPNAVSSLTPDPPDDAAGVHLEILLELLQSPACHVNAAGHLAHINSAWKFQVGMPAAAGLPWLQLISPEHRGSAAATFRSAVAMGERRDVECRLLDDAGNSRWFLLSLQPYRDRSGGCLCVATDIHALRLREQELQVRASMRTSMLDASADCIKLISPDGRLMHMNKAGCVALGVPEASSFGMHWLPLLPEEVRAEGARALADARCGIAGRFGGRSELPGQPPQYWDNMLTPVKDAQGTVTAVLCVSRDVTAERLAQDIVRHSQETLSIAARVGGLGIWEYDLQRDVLQCDEGWYRIMGRDPGQPIRSIAEFRPFIHPEDVDRATEVELTARDLLASQRNYGIVFRIVRPNGEIRWIRSTACLLQDDSGAARRAVGFVVDVTDSWRGELALRDANRALEEQNVSLARLSLEDPLTGVANRRFLESELARICAQTDIQHTAVAVAMIDVDYFKAYNDRYGHLQGDEALREVAAALLSIARRSDFVARYGGEEFVVVFPGMDSPETALARIAAAVDSRDLRHDASPFGRITVSCGCVVFKSGSALVPAMLLQACDDALYEAKAAGRNRNVVRIGP